MSGLLILVCGLPGTGKSTLAKNLAKKINATVLRTDVIRKELFNRPRYTEEEKKLIYDILFLIAKYLLQNKNNVIVDGTFYKKKIREKIYSIGEKTGSDLHIIECTSPEDVIIERMKRRDKRGKNLSDADFQVYKRIKDEFEPITRRHITIDTTRSVRKTLNLAIRTLQVTHHLFKIDNIE